MLSDVSYLGHTINMRYTTISYKNKKQLQRPKSEWIKLENTHEPLISKELWDIVQDIRKHKKRPPKEMDTPNLFAEHITRKNSLEVQREIDTYTRRNRELIALFKQRYEDNVLERIPNKHFRLLSAEHASLQERLPTLEERLEHLRSSQTNVTQFVDKAKRYCSITQLTREILRLFIQKIVVGEKS